MGIVAAKIGNHKKEGRTSQQCRWVGSARNGSEETISRIALANDRKQADERKEKVRRQLAKRSLLTESPYGNRMWRDRTSSL